MGCTYAASRLFICWWQRSRTYSGIRSWNSVFFLSFLPESPHPHPFASNPMPLPFSKLFSARGFRMSFSLKIQAYLRLGQETRGLEWGVGDAFPPTPTTFLLPGVHIYFFFLNICGSHDTKLTCKIWAPDTRYHTWPTPHPTSSHEYCPGSRSDCRINCPSKRITAFPASYALYRHFLSWPLKPDMTVVTWAHNLEWPALTTLKSHQLTQRRFEVF